MPSIRKQAKREQAAERQKKYDALSIEQKIELVTSRGGSKKELKRLQEKK